jgi:beta-N-acetylhexosaminidase
MSKRNLHILICILLLSIIAAGCAGPGREVISTPENTPIPEDVSPTPEPKPDKQLVAVETPEQLIWKQVERMTLKEKVGQMIIGGVDGSSGDKNAERMIRTDKVGGIIFYANNLPDKKTAVAFGNRLKSWNADNAIPMFLSVDQEGGRISRLPDLEKIPTAAHIGKTNNEAYAAAIGGLLGEEVRSFGYNMDFAPVLDINSNPDNPVIGDRSFGPQADVVTKMAIPVMKGIQSAGVIPVVKHFPGHGDTSTDSHLELPVIQKGPDQLQKLEWIPFTAAIRQGADAVMVAHILFPELDSVNPASMSKEIITGFLRDSLHFKGVVMTDDLTMKAITAHFDIGQAAVASITAGSDIVMVAHEYKQVSKVINAIVKNVNNGTLTERRIDESVTRILTLKQKYKLSDQQTLLPDLKALNQKIKNTAPQTGG